MSGQPLGVRGAALLAHVAARAEVLLRLPVDDPRVRDLTGLDDPAGIGGRCAGVCVDRGLNERVAAAGGPGDLVLWYDAHDRLHLDERVYTALRSGVLDGAARRALFGLDLRATTAPALPDLTALRRAVGTSPIARSGLAAVDRGRGEAAWQGVEIGADPHPAIPRTVGMRVVGGRGSGVVLRVEGRVGYVLTNRHVVGHGRAERRARIGVEVLVGDRVLRLRGRVVRSPTTRELAAALVATGHARDEGAARRRIAAQYIDLAVVRVVDDRLVGLRFAALEFVDPPVGTPVTMLGFPTTRVAWAAGGRRRTRNRVLVVGGGIVATGAARAATPWRGMEIVGHPWTAGGSSGGPVVDVTGGVLHGLVWGGEPGWWPGRWTEGRLGMAMPAWLVQAYVRASGLDGPAPPLRSAETARLARVLVASLRRHPEQVVLVDQLARGAGVLAEDVLAAVAASPRLLRSGPGAPPGRRLVVLAPSTVDTNGTPPGTAVDLVRGRDGRRFPVPGSTAVIGTSTAADVVLPGAAPAPDPRRAGYAAGVSAILVHRADGWWLVEAPSRAPLRVDRKPVVDQARVRPGAVIELGGQTYRLVERSAAAEPLPGAPGPAGTR